MRPTGGMTRQSNVDETSARASCHTSCLGTSKVPWRILGVLFVVGTVFVVSTRYSIDIKQASSRDFKYKVSGGDHNENTEATTTTDPVFASTTETTDNDTSFSTGTPKVSVYKRSTSTPKALQINDENIQNIDSGPIKELAVAPSRKYHIFQFSGTGVASTMTVNLLLGLFEGREQGMAYLECKHHDFELCRFFQRYNNINAVENRSDLLINSIVTKTHVVDVDSLQSFVDPVFEKVFFIGNERKDQNKLLPEAYCANTTYPNVMCLEYNDLQYNDETGLRRVVRHVKSRIQEELPYFAEVELKEEEAVQRLLDMAAAYAEFGRTNKKSRDQNRYGIGGGNASNHTLNQQQR
jgi:hypothetical protein